MTGSELTRSPQAMSAAAAGDGEGARPKLVVGRLWKTYDKEPVLKDVSFSVDDGEFLTLLGPSGSGKTTTLMVVAGFEQASAGLVEVDGRSVTHIAAHQRNIGVVFQSYSLFPHMTAARNVEFPLRMRRMPRATRDQLVRKALDRVGLLDFADRKPRQLSGGQQQRIALARALVFEPDVLLLDEPLGALDKALRERMQYEIRELHRRVRVPILYVTHDQEEALTMSDKVAVMRDGVIEQLDAPEHLYRYPINTFVAKFLGDTNLLPAEVQRVGGDFVDVKYGDGSVGRVSVHPDADVGAQGARNAVSVRPEAVRIVRDGEESTSNRFSGTVVDSTFLGAYNRLTVQIHSGLEIVARRSIVERESIQPGEDVVIGWLAEDAHILEEE